MKKIKLISIFIIFIFSLLFLLYFLYFDNNITISRYENFRNLLKRNNGGIIYNNTPYTLKMLDNSYVQNLPSNNSSRNAGLYDADGIVIDRPMQIDNKTYNNKVLKFCDFGTLELTTGNDDKLVIHPVGSSWICRLIGDFKITDSIKEAFQD